eukprot:1903982-Amphidinium_carterae.1
MFQHLSSLLRGASLEALWKSEASCCQANGALRKEQGEWHRVLASGQNGNLYRMTSMCKCTFTRNPTTPAQR